MLRVVEVDEGVQLEGVTLASLSKPSSSVTIGEKSVTGTLINIQAGASHVAAQIGFSGATAIGSGREQAVVLAANKIQIVFESLGTSRLLGLGGLDAEFLSLVALNREKSAALEDFEVAFRYGEIGSA